MKDVAKYFPTAIVSGRRRDKVHFSTKPCFCFPELDVFETYVDSIFLQVYNFVKLAELYYAGSHGMDIKGPSEFSRNKKVSTTVVA